MMDEIAFNLAVYAVPVIPGQPRTAADDAGQHERLLMLGDAPAQYLPPPPRLSAATINQIGQSWGSAIGSASA